MIFRTPSAAQRVGKRRPGAVLSSSLDGPPQPVLKPVGGAVRRHNDRLEMTARKDRPDADAGEQPGSLRARESCLDRRVLRWLGPRAWASARTAGAAGGWPAGGPGRARGPGP